MMNFPASGLLSDDANFVFEQLHSFDVTQPLQPAPVVSHSIDYKHYDNTSVNTAEHQSSTIGLIDRAMEKSMMNGPLSEDSETGDRLKQGKKSKTNRFCKVCGDKALGYNFNVITCESCKAFFRRNASKRKRLHCPFGDKCIVNVSSRRFCQKCRLGKCFEVGMKAEYIMTEEQRAKKRQRLLERERDSDLGGDYRSPSPTLRNRYGSMNTGVSTDDNSPSSKCSAAEVIENQLDDGAEILAQNRFNDQSEAVEWLNQTYTHASTSYPTDYVGSQVNVNLEADDDMVTIRIPKSALAQLFLGQQHSHGNDEQNGHHGHNGQSMYSGMDSFNKPPPHHHHHHQPHQQPPPQHPNPQQMVSAKPPNCVCACSCGANANAAAAAAANAAANANNNANANANAGSTNNANQKSMIDQNSMVVPQPSTDRLNTPPTMTNYDSNSNYLVPSTSSQMMELVPVNGCNPIVGSDIASDSNFSWQSPPLFYPDQFSNGRLEELLMANEIWSLKHKQIHNWMLDPEPTPEELFDIINYGLRRVIQMTHRVTPFRNLSKEDRISLLLDTTRVIFYLRSLMKYDADNERVYIEYPGRDYLPLHYCRRVRGGVYKETKMFMDSYPERLRMNYPAMIILSAVALFDPDNVHVTNKDAIASERNHYRQLLKEYLETTSSPEEAEKAYTFMMQSIKRVRNWINNYSFRMYFDIDPISMEPKGLQILDIE